MSCWANRFGPIAISIAASKPERLKGLILCATFVRNPYPVLSMLRYVIPCLPISLMPFSIYSFFLLGRFATKELNSDLAKALASVTPQALKARLNAVLACDVRNKLEAINVPVFYLRATEDMLVRLSSCREVQRNVKGMRLVEFNAPHFLLQTRASEVATFFQTII